jgi:hypothetical protein
MKTVCTLAALAALVWAADAQDSQKEYPKPGKEHGFLKQFEGQWDAVSKMTHDGKSMESKGTETGHIAYDGYWLILEFNGDHMGKPFAGQGSMGFDPHKKKFLMTWIDNMAPFAMWAEGDADAAGKTFTFTSEGYCPDLGKTAKFKTVMQFQDAKHRSITFFRTEKEGAEQKMGEIQYTRRS